MRVKDYIKTNTDLIPVGFESYISSVLDELYDIRANREATEEYCNKIDRISWILKQSLIQITEKDPSYGYFYNHFARILNGQHKCEIYHCVLDYNIINFYIDFCWDDLEEQIAGLSNEGKLSILIKKKAECKKSNFNDDLKKKFIENCEAEICMIRELMALTNITPEPSLVDKSLANTPNSSNEEKGELFARDLCDFIEKEIKGVQYTSNHHAIEIFNCPKEYGCKIEFKSKGRTLYLIKILYKYLIHINKQAEAKTWRKEMAQGLGVSLDDISRSTLRGVKGTEDARFRNKLHDEFKRHGMNLDKEKPKE